MSHYSEPVEIVNHAYEDLAESIARWVGANAESESRFLTPSPSWCVDAAALLDHVADSTGVSKEQLGRWAAEELQA